MKYTSSYLDLDTLKHLSHFRELLDLTHIWLVDMTSSKVTLRSHYGTNASFGKICLFCAKFVSNLPNFLDAPLTIIYVKNFCLE